MAGARHVPGGRVTATAGAVLRASAVGRHHGRWVGLASAAARRGTGVARLHDALVARRDADPGLAAAAPCAGVAIAVVAAAVRAAAAAAVAVTRAGVGVGVAAGAAPAAAAAAVARAA